MKGKSVQLSKGAKRLLVLAVFVLLSNVYPINPFFVMFVEGFLPQNRYASASYQFEDVEIPMKHRTYESIQRRFKEYKLTHPADSILYRLFKKNPLLFWRWGAMFTHPGYQLPYLKPSGRNEK